MFANRSDWPASEVQVAEINPRTVKHRERMWLYIADGGGVSCYDGALAYDAGGRLLGWMPDAGQEPNENDAAPEARTDPNLFPADGGQGERRAWLHDRIALYEARLVGYRKALADLDLTDAERLERQRQHSMELSRAVAKLIEDENRRARGAGPGR